MLSLLNPTYAPTTLATVRIQQTASCAAWRFNQQQLSFPNPDITPVALVYINFGKFAALR